MGFGDKDIFIYNIAIYSQAYIPLESLVTCKRDLCGPWLKLFGQKLDAVRYWSDMLYSLPDTNRLLQVAKLK